MIPNTSRRNFFKNTTAVSAAAMLGGEKSSGLEFGVRHTF